MKKHKTKKELLAEIDEIDKEIEDIYAKAGFEGFSSFISNTQLLTKLSELKETLTILIKENKN